MTVHMTNAAELVVEKVRLLLENGDVAEIETRLAGPEGETRNRLRQLFGLSGPELDVLDCAVAVAVEPSLGIGISKVQGMPAQCLPTIVAMRLVFGHGPEPIPRSGSPLLTWSLVRVSPAVAGVPGGIEADPAIVEWYFGLPSLAGVEGLAISKPEQAEPLEEWQIKVTAQRIKAALSRGRPVRVVVSGLEGSGRAGLASALAKELGQKALLVQSSGDGATKIDAVSRLQRLAWLMPDLAPIWRGDPCAWPPKQMLARLQFVTVGADVGLPRVDGVIDLPVVAPSLATRSRDRLAKALLPASIANSLSPVGAPRLADLADAAALGIAQVEEFHAFLRHRTRERVKGVGQIVSTKFGWDDLILPAPIMDLLRSIESEARAREALLAKSETRRLFEGAAALTALFAGPPGTGKSMAGQVVAAALSLDLLVIDTGAISSKYIGDTAKNLTNAFAVARELNCAIMFEEADGMFAKRVESDSVNARHANADTGHLLQLVEAHQQLVMLSTNKRGNIDPAFQRRLRFIVDFPMPEVAERRELWMRMLGALGIAEPKELAEPVALTHPLSAAQIKSAALSAAFLAKDGNISAAHILAGIQRELAKEGRIGEIVATTLGRRVHG